MCIRQWMVIGWFIGSNAELNACYVYGRQRGLIQGAALAAAEVGSLAPVSGSSSRMGVLSANYSRAFPRLHSPPMLRTPA